MRIALCHEWAVTWGGSEQVAARIAAALDVDEVFTFAAAEEVANAAFPGRTVHASRIGRSRLGRRAWRWLLPLMARWWRSVDLSAYDVVVTVSHATVNSIGVRPGAVHVSYCCTPMRYAWEWRSEFGRIPLVLWPFWPGIAALLRAGDGRRARNVHQFLAVSQCVAERISRWYGARSIVVYPPVDVDFFAPDASVPREDFFLYAGRLVPYKRPDVAVEAARRASVRLVVAGSGPELGRLRRAAGPNIEFRPNPSNAELRDLYRRARALVFPGVEDFGIVMVEAHACGTPVVAYRAGGAAEAVVDGTTGLLYDDASVAGVAAALKGFDPSRYDVDDLRRHAARFSQKRFDEEIRALVGEIGVDGAASVV